MDDSHNDIMTSCTAIINSPESSIRTVSEIMSRHNCSKAALLALGKVFKNIVPLYKIRIHSEKTKHKTAELDISEYDRELCFQYNAYIKALCASPDHSSFCCAAELLPKLDHFNFADRLVAKVFAGTQLRGSTGRICLNSIVAEIKDNTSGDTLFMILDQCLDRKYSPELVAALLDSPYLHTCVSIRIEKELKYDKERIEQRKRLKRLEKKAGKGFFAKKYVLGKNERKEEKERLKKQQEVKEEEVTGMDSISEQNYIRTANALQRLYLTILKEKNRECYSATFRGLREYTKLIRKEFREGLYVLLHDAIAEVSASEAFEGISCVLHVYATSGLDFKRIINHLYGLIHPLSCRLSSDDFRRLGPIFRQLFIMNRQPIGRVHVFIQRLMLLRSVRFIDAIPAIVKELEVSYNVDLTDNAFKNKSTVNYDKEDVDLVPSKPIFEYFVFKKVI